MRVRELAEETQEWDAFVRGANGGSPFHLTTWRRVVETTFGHQPHYLLAEDAGRIEGVLPLFRVRGLLGGRALISVPYGVYGGICAASARARAALLAEAAAQADRLGARYVELRHRPGHALELPTKSLYVTFSRAISGSDEQNLNDIPRKQRRMTRQGAKFGLRAEVGLEHLDRFYHVYAASVHRLGSPVFPRRLFASIAREFGKECELLTVWKDGQVIAGVLTLLFEGQALPYYGGALPEATPFAVNDFMYWELMCHVAAKGSRVFDFGRSREGTGPYHFKRHWGFEPEPLPYQYVLRGHAQMPDLSPANSRMQAAIRAWRRLPLGVTKLVGPPITKYLP